MLRVHLWQAVSFQSSVVSQVSKCCMLRRPRLIDSHLRYQLSTSSRSLVQKPRKAVPPQNLSGPPSKIKQSASSASRKSAAYESLNAKLATRSSPTLLYRASPYTNYIGACYSVGTFLIGIAIYNYRSQYYVELAAVPGYIPVFITVGSFMIACVGFWMFLKPQNIVQTIRSLPAPNSRSPLLQIERTPFLPFGRSRITTVPHTDVTLSSTIYDNDSERRIEAAIAEIKHREERLRAFARKNLLTLPFRQAGYWIWRGFIGVKRAFTSEGFNYLHVKGNNRVWKLDKDPAWALDDGKALDRLVKIKLG